MSNTRQRFFIQDSPVRGELVHLDDALQTILAQRDYPLPLQLLLGEMLVASALLASTLKFKGRLSIQAQGQGALKWAMAECSDTGDVRALAAWDTTHLFTETSADQMLQGLEKGVLFINIEPDDGERYQGIIALESDNLAGCLAQYYDWSAQTPTKICLSCDGHVAGGLLVQLLPRSSDAEQDHVDSDLWPRVTILTNTLTDEEVRTLPPLDILHRLYHEEDVVLPTVETLQFGCTCSRERCATALQQVGVDAVQEILQEDDEIKMDCQFCNTPYRFSPRETLALFGLHLS